MRRPTLLVLAFLCFSLAVSVPLAAAEGVSLAVSAGVFDTADLALAEGGVELRWPAALPWGLGPMAGVTANEEGGWWFYGGLRRPFAVAEGWSLTPSFAASYYQRGDGKELGHELEFRSSLELTRRWSNGLSLGGAFYHLSNASISDINPGSNSLVLVLAVPLTRR